MRILRDYYEGEAVNAWYGLCWYDPVRRAVVTAPIGLNVLIVLGVKLGNWVRLELPRSLLPQKKSPRTAGQAKLRLEQVLGEDRIKTADSVVHRIMMQMRRYESANN